MIRKINVAKTRVGLEWGRIGRVDGGKERMTYGILFEGILKLHMKKMR